MDDNIDLTLLSILTTREGYNQYHKLIKKGMCIPESWQLVQDIGKFYQSFPNIQEITKEDFLVWYRTTCHPDWKIEKQGQYTQILTNALSHVAPPNVTNILRRLSVQSQLRDSLDEVTAGKLQWADFQTRVSKLVTDASVESESKVVDLSFTNLQQRSAGSGLYWRVEDLNRSIGPVAGGDVIIIAKRPEMGGTSFTVSEMTFMLEQLGSDGAVCLFNNEEAPDKVFSRIVSAALDKGYRDLMSDPQQADIDWKAWLNGKTFDLIHDTGMTVGSIHRQLKQKPYKVIGINVLLKVGGTGQLEDHDKLQSLGEELRRIAMDYNVVVLAIAQADPSCEGVRWPSPDRIYKSKTALQGEADVLLFIGRGENDPDDMRGLHVAKNKIPPAPCVDLSLKHMKCEVKFHVDTGRFESVNFRSHSYGRGK